MTSESQLIAIAEVCGWWHGVATNELPVERDGMRLPNTFGPPVEAWWKDDVKGVYGSPPDYLKDLNAIHDAEKLITDEEWPKYRDLLHEMAFKATPPKAKWFRPQCCTAAQRAEAFLRVKGLWK